MNFSRKLWQRRNRKAWTTSWAANTKWFYPGDRRAMLFGFDSPLEHQLPHFCIYVWKERTDQPTPDE